MSDVGKLLVSYLDALKRAKEAAATAQRLADVVKAGAESLKHWRDVRVVNGKGGFPPGVGQLITPGTVDANTWPTALQLEEALVAYHQARQEAHTAHRAIPDENRHGIETPP